MRSILNKKISVILICTFVFVGVLGIYFIYKNQAEQSDKSSNEVITVSPITVDCDLIFDQAVVDNFHEQFTIKTEYSDLPDINEDYPSVYTKIRVFHKIHRHCGKIVFDSKDIMEKQDLSRINGSDLREIYVNSLQDLIPNIDQDKPILVFSVGLRLLYTSVDEDNTQVLLDLSRYLPDLGYYSSLSSEDIYIEKGILYFRITDGLFGSPCHQDVISEFDSEYDTCVEGITDYEEQAKKVVGEYRYNITENKLYKFDEVTPILSN